jgi:hypothetical protein
MPGRKPTKHKVVRLYSTPESVRIHPACSQTTLRNPIVPSQSLKIQAYETTLSVMNKEKFSQLLKWLKVKVSL